MKLLKDILFKVRIDDVIGSTHIAIERLCIDSREVKEFSCFIASRGVETDGHLYINSAINSGAVAVICEEFPDEISEHVTYVKVLDAKVALGFLASNFYDNPSEKIKLVGITGTNGKTTVATLLHQLFISLGYRVGLISTVVNKIHKEDIVSTHTTPDPIRLNALLSRMVENDVTHCFMEVSSHAVDQKRIDGLVFQGGVFTNITHDHLDYHKTFDNYIKAKKGFFDKLPNTAFALVNKDDYHADVMVQNCKAKVQTFALKTLADFKGKIIENLFSGLHLSIGNNEVYTRLVGSFNASNLLAVYGVACLLGEASLTVLTDLSNLKPVSGRFQYYKSLEGVFGIVDYAHTPDALKNVLDTIKDLRTGNESVITVVGCGGNRDKAKRPEMAKIACNLSDKVIFTSDNPRNEDPMLILKDMEAGIPPQDFKKTLTIEDRKAAIKTACSMAKSGDIILIAGKGHEKYQEIMGVKHPFDDVEELKKMLINPTEI